MPPWKRNLLAGLIGTALGLYVGQYFPDLYFGHVSPYLPDLKQLEEIAPLTQDLKPNPDHPKSIRDIPENVLMRMGRAAQVE